VKLPLGFKRLKHRVSGIGWILASILKVKFTLEQDMEAQKGRRSITLLFL
jgi:hypothetical protein